MTSSVLKWHKQSADREDVEKIWDLLKCANSRWPRRPQILTSKHRTLGCKACLLNAGPFKPHPRSAAWFPKPDQFASDSCGDTAPAQEDAQDRLLTYFAEIREMKKVMRPKKLMLKTPRLLKSSSLIPLQRLPLGHQTAREPRAVDRTLEHGHIAFLEYRVGEGTNRQSAQSRAKKSQHFVPDANFDVQFLSDTHPREVALTLDRYSAAQNALVVGSVPTAIN